MSIRPAAVTMIALLKPIQRGPIMTLMIVPGDPPAVFLVTLRASVQWALCDPGYYSDAAAGLPVAIIEAELQ